MVSKTPICSNSELHSSRIRAISPNWVVYSVCMRGKLCVTSHFLTSLGSKHRKLTYYTAAYSTWDKLTVRYLHAQHTAAANVAPLQFWIIWSLIASKSHEKSLLESFQFPIAFLAKAFTLLPGTKATAFLEAGVIANGTQSWGAYRLAEGAPIMCLDAWSHL